MTTAAPATTTAHRTPPRQPGDRLTHPRATHITHGQLADCPAGSGCISSCGIDLSGPAWSCRDADLPISTHSCLMCKELWRTQ